MSYNTINNNIKINNNISLPSYLNKLDIIKQNTEILIINDVQYCIPDSFYIDNIILSKYCWHCQYCNKKHIYLNCSFEQLIDLTLFYECNNCKKKLPVRMMRIHYIKFNLY